MSTAYKSIEAGQALLDIRAEIEKAVNMKDLTEEQQTVAHAAYEQITRRKVPAGCTSCGTVFKILVNWMKIYDKQPGNVPEVKLEPITNAGTSTDDTTDPEPPAVDADPKEAEQPTEGRTVTQEELDKAVLQTIYDQFVDSPTREAFIEVITDHSIHETPTLQRVASTLLEINVEGLDRRALVIEIAEGLHEHHMRSLLGIVNQAIENKIKVATVVVASPVEDVRDLARFLGIQIANNIGKDKALQRIVDHLSA